MCSFFCPEQVYIDVGTCVDQSCQIGLFEAKNNKFCPFLIGWPQSFLIFIKYSWPFFKSIDVYIIRSKIFPFLKQSLTFFQLQAAGNPGVDQTVPSFLDLFSLYYIRKPLFAHLLNSLQVLQQLANIL